MSSLTAERVDGAIEKYVDEYVLCKVCCLPGTKLITESRQTFIRCQTFIRYEVRGTKYPLR